MVQCDSCDRWYHFRCVEVSSSIADVDWNCPFCDVANKSRLQAPTNDTNKPLDHQNQPPLDTRSVRSRTSNSVCRSESKRKVALQLRKLEEAKAIEQRYLDKKYEILSEFGSDVSLEEDEIESLPDSMTKIEKWIESTNHIGERDDSGLPVEGNEGSIKHNVNHDGCDEPRPRLPGRSSRHHPRLPVSDQHGRLARRRINQRSNLPLDFNPDLGSTPNEMNRINPSGEETICILNRSQLAARQAVSKDLPDFCGNPEDWPLFYSMFNTSTQMCGFSNEENMLRLRKCLKAKALEAVRCRLLHPSNVAGVISTLKMLYGRPETIIQAIVRKVRSLPSPRIENLETLVNFSLTVENLCATIQACEVDDFVYNASLRYELVERLPASLKLDWAKASRGNLTPTLLDFSSWLYTIAEDASVVMMSEENDTKFRVKKNGYLNVHFDAEENRPAATIVTKQPSMKTCVVCKGDCLSIAKCKRFVEFSYNSRWATIKELKLCRKCLRRHNGPCNQQRQCGTNGCTFLHHPLLHSNGKSEVEVESTSSNTASNSGVNFEHTCNLHQGQSSEILFRFIPVILYGPSKSVLAYAFIDDGSELTLLEKSLADELGVNGPSASLCLKWTGETRRTETSSQRVSMQISGSKQLTKRFELTNVRTVQQLQLRPQTMIVSELQKRFRHLAGLPIESYQDARPRILIGVDHAKLGHVMRSREGKLGEPIAVKMRLGWTVYGCMTNDTPLEHAVNYHVPDICPCNQEGDDRLHRAMKEYFSLDAMGIISPAKSLLSADDQRAHHLLDTLTERKGQRYESGLLWKYDNARLPDSRPMALRRWECLERRMKNDKLLSDVLNAKIDDYLSKGYIRKLTKEELSDQRPRTWYLPVFPVSNPNKPEKTRLVWDGAASAHGVSLNSVLLKGPDLLTPLLDVLIRFREYRTAVCGDIREMYHQILMKEDDQNSQRFYWGSKDGSTEPTVYTMQVMTFGACCSPSVAQYVKNKNAELYRRQYPSAVQAIIKQHYVDDMLVSVESEEEAAILAQNVKWIHGKGGFEMRNWLSNSTAVLTKLGVNTAGERSLDVGSETLTEKILGMWWSTVKDCFTFKVSARNDKGLLSGHRRPTKREVLRTLMMVFDPLGLIAHFLMFLKVLLQEIWRSGIGWDEEINDQQFKKWLQWVKVLPKVENVAISRCYRILTSVGAEIQMHTFVDASENGFAAAVYLRYKEGNSIECTLVCAKTRVAPLKFLSIPRSELQAAVLGVRLANTVQRALTVKVHQRFFYTDAKDVYCWLNSDHRRYSQFVAVRVSEILESTETHEWLWIPSNANVADEGTKWKDIPELNPTGRWYRSLEFLWKPQQDWPLASRNIGTTDEELRSHLLVHTAVLPSVIPIEKFSCWKKLLRCTGMVLRYVYNLRRKMGNEPILSGPLTRNELVQAESYLHRIAQGDYYADEIAVLMLNREMRSQERSIPKSSSVYRLCPFLDENNVLRVRGRTSACKLIDQDAANPIILPRDHHITILIVRNHHQRFHHQNHEITVNELRQRFSIARLKAVYKKVRADCQQCKIDCAAPRAPAMADLPATRLAAYCRPFTYIGVDYFGPFTVSIGRRTEKRWGVLATCLTTRAIHLQIAHTLSTDSCIMALRNIMARRGVPAVIWSDRGTNFQGTDKELQSVLRNIDQDRLMAEFISTHTEWRFNPPASPHMGGAWERLIRTVKQNLSKIASSRVTTVEVLENALAEVENIVNSRPLTNIPIDDDNSPVLTPNHF
ncbi:uncharacterized protein LOC131676095 [Topomyia yanbarensis]|uniref:uncharacterized protein LOC131676095 n=1 Tax=Topomyia yanbarensis TaxID=2498891 RepID=UPI00273B914A|nr:uncharacterized protein LOC131676095 [Topomyia yanbarensis]